MFKTPIYLAVSALWFAVVLLPAGAQAPASDAQKQPINAPIRGKKADPVTPDMLPHSPQKVIIPELTEVPVILKDEIQSGGNRAGSELLFFVAKDIYGPGHTFLIARGTPVLGKIVESHPYDNFGRAGKLVLRADYILAQDKTRIPLRGVKQEGRGAAQNGNAALLSLTGGGVIVDLFLYGRDSKLHIGKTYTVYVNADTQTESPTPNLEPDVSDLQTPREAFALLKDGSWAIGLLRQVGNNYVLTNSGGSMTVKIADVRSLEYPKEAGTPTPSK